MNEQGSMMPLVAGLVLATAVIIALAVDVTLYASAVREAAFAADSGAEAGAAQIDRDSRYRGILAVDRGAAEEAAVEAALASRPRSGRSVDVIAEAGRVCVTVIQPFSARLVTVQTEIAETACAVPVEG